jgi:outer membrane lipoprotein-sorting protein
MRKITMVVLALGLMGGVVVGCGTPSEKSVAHKIEAQVKSLDQTNYQSTATMVVQMDKTSQSYYVETWYESPDVYRIALGDSSQNIHQYIIHNQHGMFIVSPSLGRVFRFNGNWAENQGHIYLYDQILSQIAAAKDAKMTKIDNQYSFVLPVSQANEVVVKQKVLLDAKTLSPKLVTLLDKNQKAVVSLKFDSFKQNVTFQSSDFDPQSIISADKTAKTTVASDGTTTDESQVGMITPDEIFGDSLESMVDVSNTSTILRYAGNEPFTLSEFRPNATVAGMSDGEMVDLFGVPAVYSGGALAHQLSWINNGVEFDLTSSKLSLDQMQSVAISTMGQSGK